MDEYTAVARNTYLVIAVTHTREASWSAAHACRARYLAAFSRAFTLRIRD
jgi:hypothetical protein